MNALQEQVYTRLVRAMAQLAREMNGLPECGFTIMVTHGELTVTPTQTELAEGVKARSKQPKVASQEE